MNRTLIVCGLGAAIYFGSAHYTREQALAVLDQGCQYAMTSETCQCFTKIHREEQPLERYWIDMFTHMGIENVERAQRRIERECRVVRNERFNRRMQRRTRRN